MKLSGVIEALMAAGGSPEQIVAVVRAAEAAQEAEAADRDALAAEKRADAAAKKRMQREASKMSRGQAGTDEDDEGQIGTKVDNRDTPSPPPALPPGPPNPPTPTPVVIPQSPSGSRPKPVSRSSEFWAVYPKRRGSNPRHLAIEKFDRLVKAGEDADAIIAGTKSYARAVRDDDPKFVKQAIGFLNGRMWEDYLGGAPRSSAGGLFGAEPSATEPLVELPGGIRWPESRVIAKVAEYRANPRSWLEMIGPPPGQPGCRIPQHLIDQARAA